MRKSIGIISAVMAFMIALMPISEAAYKEPQKYSSDDYTSPAVEPEIPPEPEEQKNILVYFNGSLVELKNAPIIKNETLYVPVSELFSGIGLDVEIGRKIIISNDVVSAEFKKGGNTGTVNGKSVELTGKIIVKGGTVMAPAGILAEVLNAKVWYDENSKTLAVTTGKYKDDDIIRIINYKFWMNGEPYYEISFNKFDLAYQISAYYFPNHEWPTKEYQIEAAEAALKQLRDCGFRTIRVFVTGGNRAAYFKGDTKKEAFYEMMDTMYDLADKYGIQITVCLGLPSNDFVVKGENYFDLICVKDSESRKQLYQFIDEYVARYKNRKSVLMWEITNEGNLDADIGWQVKKTCYSIYQLGEFYADCAERIKMTDPDHLVTGGDSCLRASQWHQYLGVKNGTIGVDWTRDTLEDRIKAYTVLYHGLDVISMHCYSTGLGDSEFAVSGEDKTTVKEDFNLYMQEARRAGKVLYNGETAVNADSYDEEVYRQSLEYIQSIIEAGVQISHWWTFRADRQGFDDGYGWKINEGELLEAIIEGNRQLKETYVVNAAEKQNTNSAWEGSEDTTVVETITEKGTVSGGSGCASSACGTEFAVFVIIAAAVVCFTKKKEKN